MVMIGKHVPEQQRLPLDLADYYVHFAVVKQVAEGRATPGDHLRKGGSLYRRDNLELAIVHVAEQQRFLSVRRSPVQSVCRGIDVSVDKHQVEPAIIVIVQESRAPSEERNGDL